MTSSYVILLLGCIRNKWLFSLFVGGYDIWVFLIFREKKPSDFYLKVIEVSAALLLNCDSFLFI